MVKGISVCMVLYNEGEEVRNPLESVKDIADEIIIIHDGPCKNNTLDICREYTSKIFVREWQGMCEYHQAFAYRRAKYDWILKLDADEYLSPPLQKNIRELINTDDVEMYTFICPYWDPANKKYITKTWPRKGNFYRKNKISYFGFTNWGQPRVKGKIVDTPFLLEHRPKRGLATNWDIFWKRSINNSALFQARDTLKDFKEFDSFGYKLNDFPLQIRVRRRFPLLSAVPIAIYSMFLDATDTIGWRESPALRLKLLLYHALKYLCLGYYIFKIKKNKNYQGMAKK